MSVSVAPVPQCPKTLVASCVLLLAVVLMCRCAPCSFSVSLASVFQNLQCVISPRGPSGPSVLLIAVVLMCR